MNAMPMRVRGVTLVELMVGMALGLFLVGVMGTIFLGSKGTFQAQNHVARLQESARFSVDTVSADLRMAGFRGCRGLGVGTPLVNTLNTPTAFRYNFAQGVWASRHNGSAWGPALISRFSSARRRRLASRTTEVGMPASAATSIP